MDKKQLIELTNKVYRLTILFPKKEPLRYKIREIADDILANCISWEVLEKIDKNLDFTLKKNVEIIRGYLNVAKWQNWASYFDILEIEEKYGMIYTKFDVKPVEEKKKDIFDNRKEKIIEILGQKERLQVREANDVFPNISKRTIRRDFVELLREGLIERVGEGSETFYKLKILGN